MKQPRDIRETPHPTDSEATSASLLGQLKQQDAAAWERLVSLYTPLVHHWCRKLGLPQQDTADVFQEVFQSVAAHIGTFRKEKPGDTFRGWLRTITRHKVIDHYRKLDGQPAAWGGTDANLRLNQFPADSDSIDEPPEDQEEQSVCREVMHRALEMIRGEFQPRTWQAFWRVVVDGQRPVDVAEEMGMRPGAVRVAKSRVLQRLRRELGDVFE